jgi:hypothetical protein
MPPASAVPTGSVPLPKRNYGFEKRQKELERQRKKEEKRKRKLDRVGDPPAEVPNDDSPSLDLPPRE